MGKHDKYLFYLQDTAQNETDNWRRILDALPVGVLISSPISTVYRNSQFANFAEDFCHSELSPRFNTTANTDSVRHSTEEELILKSIDERAREGNVVTVLLNVPPKKKRMEILVLDILFSGRKCKAYIVKDYTLIDELEEKKLEEKYTKLTLNSLTHELRTPLYGIVGMISLLKDLELEQNARNYAARALNSCELMEYLINDVCDLMFLQSKSLLELRKDSFTPLIAVQDIYKLFEMSMREKGLLFTASQDENVPKFVITDLRRYKQVLVNLLANAVKYTRTGGIRIHISYKGETRSLVTRVEDSGIGIPSAGLSQLFKLYANVPKDTLQPQGIGLGLTCSKLLCEVLDGNISVESEVNRGSVFTFSFIVGDPRGPGRSPISGSDIPAEALGSATTSALGSGPGSHPHSHVMVEASSPKKQLCPCAKLLCVDDDGTNRFVIKGYSGKLHIPCETAPGGAEAIEMIVNKMKNQCCGSYKLVLMDINMPVIDGIETTKRLINLMDTHAISPAPIVAFTAVTGTVDDTSYCDIGFREVVNKPLTLEQFERLMKKYGVSNGT